MSSESVQQIQTFPYQEVPIININNQILNTYIDKHENHQQYDKERINQVLSSFISKNPQKLPNIKNNQEKKKLDENQIIEKIDIIEEPMEEEIISEEDRISMNIKRFT